MKKEIGTAISYLIKKACSTSANDSLKYSQAALNLAHAQSTFDANKRAEEMSTQLGNNYE